MYFVSIEFLLVFLALLGAMFLVRQNGLRKGLLLAASYYLYWYWDHRFLWLVVAMTLSDWAIARRMEAVAGGRSKRWLLVLSLVVNLSVLGFFKYYGFFVESLQALVPGYDLGPVMLRILAPLGVSFFVFQGIAYSVEVYRGNVRACRNVLDYGLYIAFFPKIVAGPIVKPVRFLPQLAGAQAISRENFGLGFRLFALGFFKKVFLADHLAPFVNYTFLNAAQFDGLTTALAVLAFTLQIYFDFAGYSDMAIGLARILGYDLGVNFNWPYLSRSVAEFWRRWHISLSEWIRDYLYIPLGGNRKGRVRTWLNLVLAMALCGLWHGAAWTFLAWGAFHGAAMVVQRIWGAGRKADQFSVFGSAWRWAATFAAVALGWVFFRADSFGQAWLVLGRMAAGDGIRWTPPLVLFIAGATGAVHLLKISRLKQIVDLPLSGWYTPAVLFSLLWISVVFFPAEFAPFVYAKF